MKNDAVCQSVKRSLHLSKEQILDTLVGRRDTCMNADSHMDRTIGDFVDAVKKNSDAKSKARRAYGTNAYSELKKALPQWYLCGNGGATQGAIRSNGFVTIDIDHTETIEEAFRVKEILCGLPFIALAGLSIGEHGVFALAYAPEYAGNHDKIKCELYRDIEEFLSVSIDAKIDQACTDISRGRFESYDKDIYVADQCVLFNPIDRLEADTWHNSEVKRLAELLGYSDIAPNHPSVGGILALSAASARSLLWDKDLFDEQAYQARVGCVILGESGECKGKLKTKLSMLANRLKIWLSNSKSTADMSLTVSKAANVFGDDTWTPKHVKDIEPIVEINDEEYASRDISKVATYAMDKYAERRKMLDVIYQPQSTKKDSLPRYGFTPCYSYLCISQPESYAEATATDNKRLGDGRRELICEFPKVDSGYDKRVMIFRVRLAQSGGAKLDAIENALMDAYRHLQDRLNPAFEQCIDATTDKLCEAVCNGKIPAMAWDGEDVCKFTLFRCLNGLDDTEKVDAMTHIPNIACLSAYLTGRNKIKPDDILVASAITRASMMARRRLYERCEEIATAKDIDRGLRTIKSYWQDGKKVSLPGYTKYKTGKGLTNNVPVREWEKTYLHKYKEGNNYYLRLATQKEIDQMGEALAFMDTLKSESEKRFVERTTTWNCKHEQWDSAKRPEYPKDNDKAREIRCLEFIRKIEREKGGMIDGNRNNCLLRLCVSAKKAGMWDQTMKNTLTDFACSAGLSNKEIGQVMKSAEKYH